MRTVCLALVLCAAAAAQDGPPQGGPPRPGVVKPAEGDRIAWYGTWDRAKAEAERTGRPILLVAAAPHCHNISGVW